MKQLVKHVIAAGLIGLVANHSIHAQARPLTGYVNPFIGSEEHGHVFVGANVPFGAVQLGPTQIGRSWDEFNGWDWCSGYNYISQEILGFTHTHLSGTGIGDLNDIMIVPANGPLQLRPMQFEKPETGYGSLFSKKSEVCHPGFYQVHLDKYGVDAKLTATERVGIHQYHYNKTENAHILVDLGFAMNWDSPVKTFIRQVNDSTFTGYRFSTGWSKDQRLYFAIRTSQPILKAAFYNDSTLQSGREVESKRARAALYFDAASNPDMVLKVALSPISEENALANMNAEAPSGSFDAFRLRADQVWEKTLGAIEVETKNDTDKEIFYTSLYHMFLGPTLFNDANNDYLGTDKKVYKNAPFKNYTTMSLWDIYRGWGPFMSIVRPSLVKDITASMLAIHQQQGRLPVWPLVGSETDCMVGNPAIIILADAFGKGIIPADQRELVYQAMKHTALRDSMGLEYLKKLSYIPADKMHESVAWAMEYAIADAGVARVASALGKKADAEYFTKRSQLYKLYYDKQTGFFNGRFADGKFRRPFDPLYSVPVTSDYTEGNAWQYLFLVPQDVNGLITLLGGQKAFKTRLDSLFTISSKLHEGTAPDISGLIGQYAHGNEPSHHITYLYNYLGEPWKTADLVREVIGKFYKASPDGLAGNEDVGQMSAWYAFSALGMYSVNPMEGKYFFGSPLFDSAKLHLENGKTFAIKTNNNSAGNKYIQKIEYNGKPYPYTYILHKDVIAGGELVFYMGAAPGKTYGVSPSSR
ncbi:GH92 family glycosyl hydrolase [Dyadobacter sp. CY261]|uniref:GH92 family glycosyl hydrolase n=1 Tax=Dyadobacter sp. CY261 TaxID=2907203 RepID=UPI001F38E632|nr:GH92 family glycosyl hydrolase [Dyadobacter sp. CY261]MCF0072875.1 GH92 family glycosyl hydrolase [Dyadobacter sp. CY261]